MAKAGGVGFTNGFGRMGFGYADQGYLFRRAMGFFHGAGEAFLNAEKILGDSGGWHLIVR